MSWWVYLEQKGTNLSVENFAEGGTYAIGGQEMPELNITYNYGKFYGLIDSEKGLLWIHRKKAKTCIPRLEKAIKELGTKRSANYWDSTEGNAGYALSILLKWAKQYPDARFRVS